MRVKTVSLSTFQDVYFDGSLEALFISWCYNHGKKERRKKSVDGVDNHNLNSQKFKVALNTIDRFSQKFRLSCFSKFDNI